MFFDNFRKWLNQAIQTVRHGQRPKGRPFVRAYRPILEALEERVTPTTYTPTTTADLTFTSVNSGTGVITGGTGAGQVTLRSAIIASNQNGVGADIIDLTGGGTFTLALANAGGLNEDACQTGDLDVRGDLTITGAGASTTIIQAGTTNLNGIDKVLAINPVGDFNPDFSMTGVTIRFGRNTQAFGAADFSYTGGGMDFFGTNTSTFALSNCIITDNTNVNGYGGGLNIDEGLTTTTTVTITNTVFTNNTSGLWGGGLNIFGENGNTTITGSTFSNNIALGTGGGGGQGGGINIRVEAPSAPIPSVNISNTTVSGNQAAGAGGGIAISGGSSQIVTIADTAITGNFSKINGITSSRGGGLSNENGQTTTLTRVLISGNHAEEGTVPDGGGLVNAAGTLIVRNSTISGNLSGGDAGGFLSTNGPTTTFTNSTISNNRSDTNNNGSGAGGGIHVVAGGIVNLQNTIVDGNFKGTASAVNEVSGTVVANFSLIGNTAGATLGAGSANNQTNVSGRLAALANNGGPTVGPTGFTAVLQTHALGSGSAALDTGLDALATAAGLTTDQRGGAYGRSVDAADADITNEADIGALEQHPTVEDLPNATINEDGTLNTSFNVGDANLTSGLDTITVTSNNNTLVPNANINVGGTGINSISNSTNGVHSLVITPVANLFGTATITITVTDIYNGVSFSQTDTFVLTVDPVADLPSVTNSTTNEDTQTTTGLVVTRNAVDGNEVTHFKITNITNGTLFQNNGTTQINNNDFITFAQANAGLKFTPAANLFSPGATFSFDVAGATSAAGAGLGPAVTATITVNPVADTPSVTNATTNEDTQSTTGLVISRNPADGAEVTHFKITNIQNGTLFQNDGTTQITNGTFITFAQGNAGLKFTPSANFFGDGSFDVRAALSDFDTFTALGVNTNLRLPPVGLGGSVPPGSFPPPVNNDTTVSSIGVSGLTIPVMDVNVAVQIDYPFSGDLEMRLVAPDGTTVMLAFQAPSFGGGGNFYANTTFDDQAANSFATAATPYTLVQPVSFTGAGTGLSVLNGMSSAVANGTWQLQVKDDRNGDFGTLVGWSIAFVNGPTDNGSSVNVDTATITVNAVADTPSVTNATTNEDTQTTSGLVVSRNAADTAEVTHFKITNILGGTLFLNDGTTQVNNNTFITFAQANAGLKFTPGANLFSPGTTFSFDVQASVSNADGGLGGSVVTATITVNPVADTPTVTNSTTNEDVQTTTGLVITPNAADGVEVTHFKITNILNGTLFLNDGVTQISAGSFITAAQGSAGLKFTPNANFFGTGSFDVQASLSSVDAGLGGGIATATIIVNAVADTPSVTNAITAQDTQTTSGLVISRNPADGPEVTHFKITSITNGTLFQNDGATQINNGDFITFAQGNAGLKFTPALGFLGSGTFDVQASLSNSDSGLGGGVVTATITVNPVIHTPTVTNSTTNEDTQTTSGLVISRNVLDGPEVTHFKITNITNGTLFQNDGTTQINNGDFITFAQGNAGLKFTPSANFFGTGSFDVQSSASNQDTGLGGGIATATIIVNAVADTPSVTNATTNEDTQTTSGLVISRNAADGPEVTHFKITNILGGTLFLNDGTTQITNGSFITFAQGNAGLKFTPAANLFSPTTTFSFGVQASLSNNDTGLGGSTATATITVNPLADTPSVTNATTNEDTQTTSGLVISRNAADNTEVTHFKVTNILNGTLFQNDGTTQINSGDFITFAQGNAGLKFTPNANFFGTGSFDVQASTSNSNPGLGGGIATATIIVNSVADTPSVTNATTNEDTQTTSGLVITRNAVDSNEVTHFKITNILNGTLFLNNGTTPINNGDFITVAQGSAGLKFTPSTNLYSPVTTFSFDVQASTANTNAGLGGGTATATITVNPIADTPSVTGASTPTNTQTTSGLVVSRNPADGAEVTHFKITNIQNGTLFQNDGMTPINNGDFITFAQGNAGLKFTPGAGLTSPSSIFRFDVQASTSNVNAGLGGGVVTANIIVGLAFFDNFDRANSQDLGPNWNTQFGGIGIAGNLAQSVSQVSLATVNGVSLLDTVLQVDVVMSNVNDSRSGLMARYSGPAENNFYLGMIYNNHGVFEAYIFLKEPGPGFNGYQLLAFKSLPTFTGTGTLRFEVVGKELKLFVNNVLQCVAYDSTITTAGAVGIRGKDNTFNDFSAADVQVQMATLPFTDSFSNPVNNSSLDRVWTDQAGAFTVQGGAAVATDAVPGVSIATLNTAPLADCLVNVDVSVASTLGARAGLLARYSGTGGSNYYLGMIYHNGANYEGYIFLNQGGTFTQLAFKNLTGIFTGNGTVRFEAVGNQLKLFVGNVLQLVAYDSTITTPGLVGMRSRNATANSFNAAAIPTQTTNAPFTDTFTTNPNSPNLERVWTERLGAFTQNGQAVAGNFGTVNLATLNLSTPLGSTDMSANVTVASANGARAGLVARYSGPGDSNYYLGMVFYNGTNFEAYIFVNQGGSFTQLAFKNLTGIFTGTGPLRFQAIGNSLTLYVNNVPQLTVNNGAFASGLVGMRNFNANLDDFSVS